jgi:hypothetical protein
LLYYLFTVEMRAASCHVTASRGTSHLLYARSA